MEWFYVDVDGESKGPISTDEVKQLPLNIFVWNGCTVNKWTELKDLQSLIEKEAQQEYDCQYHDSTSDDDIVEDHEDTININAIQASNKKAQNVISLAVLSQFTVNNSDEDTVDEELTPGPIIDAYEPLQLQYTKPNINHENDANIHKNHNKNDILNTENNNNININININGSIGSIDSPTIPSQDLESRSLPKQCSYPSYPSYHIIDKIPKKESPQIIAQPPSAHIHKKKEANSKQPKNLIQCPLCTFYNNRKSTKCSMCLTKFDNIHKSNEKHAEINSKSEKKMVIKNKNNKSEKIPKLIQNKEKSKKNEDNDMDDELNSKMEELMENLEIAKHARPAINKLPKYKKQQMINQYINMKETQFDDTKNKKEKKKSIFKKKRTHSNIDWKYGFNPLTVNINDHPLQNTQKPTKSDTYSESRNIITNPEKELDKIIKNDEIDKIRNMQRLSTKLLKSDKFVKMEEKEAELSVYDAYIKKYGQTPQNATQLMKFSKMNNKFSPLLFKQARNILTKHQNKNTDNIKNLMKKTNAKRMEKVMINSEEKNKKKQICVWDINENDGEDPLGSTYKKREILCNYNTSAINEQTAESLRKSKMGFISPQTLRYKSVFDDSSSSEDYGDVINDNQNNNRLTVNLRNAKHNNNKVSAHFAVKL